MGKNIFKYVTKLSLYKWIFGHDIFISYSRKDGLDYSYNISKYFIDKGYECYLDQLESTTPGKKLPLKIRNSVKMSNSMVIIGSNGAGLSESVAQEIAFFLNHNKNKPLIPISFDGSIEKVKWFNLIEGLPMCPEDFKNLELGQPSIKVLERIEKSLDFTKKSKRIRRISIFVFILSLILMGLSSYFSFKIKATQDEMETANKELNNAKTELSGSRQELETKAVELSKTEDSLKAASVNLQIAQSDLHSAQTNLAKVNDELVTRQYELSTVRAFEVFRQGNESLQAKMVDDAEILFDRAIRELKELKLDPLIVLHAQMRRDFSQIDASPIIPINGAASFIKISKNKEQVLVVYDYQSPGGDPDIETILDWSAFEVYDIATSDKLISKNIGSDIGSYIYSMSKYDVFEFEETGHIIFKGGDNNERYSLMDGSTEIIRKREIEEMILDPTPSSRMAIRKGLFELQTSDENLYEFHPDDGIDEYSRRLVDNVVIKSPDGRTAIAGTYEGRIFLFDLNTGLSLGEMQVEPVFDIEYTVDSKFILLADEQSIWQIDAEEKESAQNMYLELYQHKDFWKREKVVETAISPNGKIVAVATTHRLMIYDINSTIWKEWTLPEPIEGIADLNVSHNLKELIAITKKGKIFRVKYALDVSIETLKTNSKCEVVGWIATDHSTAWMTCKEVRDSIGKISKVDLTINKEASKQIEVPFANFSDIDSYFSNIEIHGLATSKNRLILIYGEPESYSDSEIIPEQLLVIPLNDPNHAINKTLFEGEFINSPVDPFWTVTQIDKIQFVGNENNMVVLTGLDGSYVVNFNGYVEGIEGKLGARQINFGSTDAYNIAVDFDSESDTLTLSINHLQRDVSFNDVLPWKFKSDPEYASFSKDGRKIIIGNQIGDFLIIDVSKYEK
ncbi:TIR domain-containing protein [Flagellimonas sp. 2504JD4-2]